MTDALDSQCLIATARERAGFEDFGDDALPERVASLVAQLERHLDSAGRQKAADVIAGLLLQRLELFGSHAAMPLGEERIERPIIAFGEGRSGTTVLQMLLGCDPRSRLLEFWEAMYPSPPPGVSDASVRRRRADEDWREILDLIPKWLISHPYNAMLGRNPPECERLWAMDFRGAPPTAWWRVPITPMLDGIGLPQDHDRQYRIHRMMLQNLQYRQEPRRWVLKGVTHQLRLRALLDAYPDAVLVWIHRDPVQAIASRFELHAQIFEGITGAVDRRAFADATIETCVRNFAHTASDPVAADPRIHHLHYKAFTADPVGSIRAIYARADIDFTDDFERAMRDWMKANPADRFGKFTYSVDSLGIDPDALEERIAGYRRRFEVPHEHRKD
jgi:hypothetical protein